MKKIDTALFVLLFSLGSTPTKAQKNIVNVSDFGARPGSYENVVPALKSAIESCKKTDNAVLVFPEGRYDFWPDNSNRKKLFGSSMHGEDIVKKDPQNLEGFSNQFCTKSAVWYYLNRLERQYIVVNGSSKSVQFSNKACTSLSNCSFTLKQGEVTLVENDDVFTPALWLQKPGIIAYNKNGFYFKLIYKVSIENN